MNTVTATVTLAMVSRCAARRIPGARRKARPRSYYRWPIHFFAFFAFVAFVARVAFVSRLGTITPIIISSSIIMTLHIYIYISMCIEREREREREITPDGKNRGDTARKGEDSKGKAWRCAEELWIILVNFSFVVCLMCLVNCTCHLCFLVRIIMETDAMAGPPF